MKNRGFLSDKTAAVVFCLLIITVLSFWFGQRGLNLSKTAANGNTNLASLGSVFPPAPTNENALCLYSASSALSKNICDYYLQKRPGVRELGLSIPDSAFLDKDRWEGMNGPEFLRYVIRPLYAYIDSHPEQNITHLAVAKDIPITVMDTEKYLDKGDDFTGAFPPKTVFVSSNFLLSVKGDYGKAENVSDYLLGSKITSDNACVALRPGVKSSRNLEYQKTSIAHFNSADYENRPYAANPRFAVSFLSGYTLADIEKMIDKAVGPAPRKSDTVWVFEGISSFFSNEEVRGFKQGIMESAGVPRGNVYGLSDDPRPRRFAKPIIGYMSFGVYNGFSNLWIANRPAVVSAVAPRAILTSVESWNARTLIGNTNHDGEINPEQGKLADAFAPNAFGGANYANSFSGAVGNVYEPTTGGVVPSDALFGNYASGLTFGESVLKSFRYLPESIYSVHIAVGDPLMRAFDEPVITGRTINYGTAMVHSPDDIPAAGARKCYTQTASCKAPDGTDIADGVAICSDDAHRQVCVNGAFVNPPIKCNEGCSLGQCVEDVFVPPNKLELKKDTSYSLVLPIKTSSSKLSDIFKAPPLGPGGGSKLSVYDQTSSEFIPFIFSIGAVGETVTMGWSSNMSWSPDFNVQPGVGFFLTPSEDYKVLLDGSPFDSSPPIHIKNRTTLFGLPFCGDKYTASEVLSEIQTLEPRCKSIENAAKYINTYPTLYWGSPLPHATQKDFKLNSHEAYWLFCDPSVDFTWTPSCDLGKDAVHAKALGLLERLLELSKRINALGQ